ALAVMIVILGIELVTPTRTEEAAIRTLVQDFLEARLTRNATKARTYLSNEFHQELSDSGDVSLVGTTNPHYHAYSIDDIAPRGEGVWEVSVTITEEVSCQGEVGWFKEALTVARIGDGYRIAGI